MGYGDDTAKIEPIVDATEVTDLRVKKVSNKTITLSWSDPASEEFDVIEISNNRTDGIIEVEEGVVEQEIAVPLNEVLYTFTVKTVDTAGRKSLGRAVRMLLPDIRLSNTTPMDTC